MFIFNINVKNSHIKKSIQKVKRSSIYKKSSIHINYYCNYNLKSKFYKNYADAIINTFYLEKVHLPMGVFLHSILKAEEKTDSFELIFQV